MRKKIILSAGAICAVIIQKAFVAHATGDAGGGGGVGLVDAINLIVQFTTIGGGLWLVWGVIILAGGLKDKNGPALQSGIWQIVGGGLIITAVQLFKNIAL